MTVESDSIYVLFTPTFLIAVARFCLGRKQNAPFYINVLKSQETIIHHLRKTLNKKSGACLSKFESLPQKLNMNRPQLSKSLLE
jgi:hypothetical protein